MSIEMRRMNPRERATMRREVLLATLRQHPLLSTGELSDVLLRETGGPPAMLTGAIYVGAWTVYVDLRKLEAEGRVRRWQTAENRSISWEAADAARQPNRKDQRSG